SRLCLRKRRNMRRYRTGQSHPVRIGGAWFASLVFQPLIRRSIVKRTLATAFAASALALAIAAPVVHAAAGETILRLKGTRVEPDVDSDINGLDVDGATGGEVGFTGFLSDHWALDLGVGTTKHDVTWFGNNVGSIKILPVNLLLQFHFAPDGGIRPYVGAG